MIYKNCLALGLVGIVLVVGLISIAAASTSMSEQVSPQAQTAKITSITYTAGHGSSHKLDLSDPNMIIPISIPRAHPLFLTVKGKCTGPTSQKGELLIYNYGSGQYQNAIQLTPGKIGTLKTNPPPVWFSTGYHELEIAVFAPDGSTYDSITIGVTVTT